ncbi:TonB-dependent receptor [Marinoscillum sp. MHG1-6]|uniref:TonB-dependent receptor n=1 Tax=Marinoscillum sp. MHG1-6 TaxID=2959627 RepID=UPI0021574274|nr:TonB-dependent receptor [Marinoscillum sp. MHG1-6]
MRGLFIILGILLTWVVEAQVQDSCRQAVSGYVYDITTKEPLPLASVRVVGENRGANTNTEGFFEFSTRCNEELDLEFSYLGYKAVIHHHDPYHEIPNIYLAEEGVLLESVVIEGKEEAFMNSTSSSSLDIKELDAKRSGNLGQLVSELSGVTTLSSGQNIVKPVIHGLHSNRILIINDGVRHEFQNWGVEHAPEIDPAQVDNLEVVKGAATVKYGPDALGGVLLINPPQLDLSAPWEGHVLTSASSNGGAGHGEIALQKGLRHMAMYLQGSATKQGDLHTPAYNLTNTGKEEFGYSGALRWHEGKFDLTCRYSRFNQKLGLLKGSVNGNLTDLQLALTSEPPHETRSFSYGLRQPYQWVDHQIFQAEGGYRLGGHLLNARYAYQVNHRQEYDLRKGTSSPTPNIDLQLASQSLDLDWVHPRIGRLNGQAGLQWQYQDNDNIPGTRTAQFIPNYNYQRLGVFAIESWERDRMTIEAGLRYDYHHTSARGVFQARRYSQELSYHNLTASFGFKNQVSQRVIWRMNLGSSWRPPNMAELYSFGRHQSAFDYGFWTYSIDETGQPLIAEEALTNQEKRVNPESGYKWISSIEVTGERLQYSFTVYTNYIANYIYTRSAGVTQTVRGAFPYFIYDQDNAFFTGFDAEAKLDHNELLSSQASASYVYARNMGQGGSYFVGTPPAQINYSLFIEPDLPFGDLTRLTLKGRYYFHQWLAPRVISVDQILEADANGENLFSSDNSAFDLMSPPKGYFLMDLGYKMVFGKLHVSFVVANVLDISYRNYTDRMRYFADEMGRNLTLSLKWKL